MKPHDAGRFLVWGVFVYPFLIVLIGVIILFTMNSCVQIMHRLPVPEAQQQRIMHTETDPQVATRIEMWKRCMAVHHLELEFVGKKLPLELRQAKQICQEAGL